MADPTERLSRALEGRYKIERMLGEGGMATVYLADDLKHDRKVALKVLKPELGAIVGAERFLGEIKVTAKLQHPNILPLHDSGEADKLLFYVMPHVEGESLRERLDREKQLPVDEAVKIVTEVADALEHAHRKGVIHRDIKPANILLSDGRPLIADFGIALAVSVAGGGRLTETGLSVGTPYYMSPEQAAADREVNPASDVYSLACVLYEMLVGEPPHTGPSAQAVLAKILTDIPTAPHAARATVPANVDAAIRKALEKLPADRFTSAQEFARALADRGFRHGEEEEAEVVAVAAAPGPWKRVAVGGWSIAALLALYTLALGWALSRPAPEQQVGRFAIPAEDGAAVMEFGQLLPDGSGMLYQDLGPQGQSMLWLRRWDATTGSPVPGTEGLSIGVGATAVSPDGREVALAGAGGVLGPLRVAPLVGGAVRALVDTAYCGCVWSSDNAWIYYTDSDGGVSRVPANGGAVSQVVPGSRPDSVDVPLTLLAGGDVLLLRHRSPGPGGTSEVRAVDLATGEIKTLVAGSSPATVTGSGQLVYGSVNGEVFAVEFDAKALEVRGAPVLMLEGVATNPIQGTLASFSRDGSLLYLPGSSSAEMSPVWVERSGDVRVIEPGWSFPGVLENSSLALSPDGNRLAVSYPVNGEWHLWIKDLDRGPLTRFTFEGTNNRRASWSPDGSTVFFTSNRGGNNDLWSRPADMSQAAELVLDLEPSLVEAFISPGGEWIVYRMGSTTGGGTDADIFGVRTTQDTTTAVFVDSDFIDWSPTVSPDGRWIAYGSLQSGSNEVYVRPFPDAGRTFWLVSDGFGASPIWSPDGRTLFYRGDTDYVAASFSTEPTFSVVAREPLFPVGDYLTSNGHPIYDVHPDGDQFVVLSRGATTQSALVLVQDWFAEVDARLRN